MNCQKPPAGLSFRSVFFSLLLYLAACPSPPALGGDAGGPFFYRPRFHPFDSGESAEYLASWNGIPVATAEIKTVPLLIDGKKFYRATVRARTWKYLDLIWKMRDVIESLFDAETIHPRRFIFLQRENSRKIDTTANFDPATQKWLVQRRQGGEVRDYGFVSPDALDPISAVYLARSADIKVGETLRMEVFGGKSRYLLALDVAGKEPVSIRSGVFEAYKIIPTVADLTGSGYAKRVRQATVWISADQHRRPLKIVSQVFIGHVTIELVGGKG